MLKKNTLIFLLLLAVGQQTLFAVTYNWNTWVAGALTYSTTNMTATVTNTAFDTRGPQDPNGGASNGYKSPKYVSNATINTYQGGSTNDYGLQGLVLGLDWANLTSSTTVTITFTTPVAGPVSFSIYDINTGSWGGNNPVWIDKITIAGTNCSGAVVYPTITGCGNTISGANSNIITGTGGCTNNTNTVTFNAPTIKTITITYASSSPLASGYGSDPDPEYIIVSSITASNSSLIAVAANAGITCTSSSVALNGSSSVANASYSWTGPNSASPAGTTPSAASTTVASAGTYVLAVTDPSSGCVFRDTVNVNQNGTPPTASIATPAQLGCSVNSVTLTASSTTGNATYAWSGGGTSATKSVSAIGTYTVTVTDPGNGCTSTASTTVTSTGNTLSISATPTNATCGNSNGSAIANITSGTATGYVWSSGATTATASNLASGTYTVTVTGNGGCTATATTTVASTGGITATASSTNTTCGSNNGTATANISSGTATSYLWSNGATTANASNLAAGTYTVTITGNVGCTATATATVASTGGITATASSTNTTCGSNNGTATATITSGTATGYLWSNGATTATASNLAAGTYMVTVTGNGGCTATATTAITSTGGITATASSTNTTCGSNNGTATANITSGTATGYVWSNGSTTATASNLAAGTYTVTVTGNGGCTTTATTTVASTGGITATASSTNTTCGSNNGTATANITSGTATGYVWSSGATTATASNLAAGTYTVTVTGNGGCTATVSVTINPSGNTPVTVTSNQTTICVGDSAQVCAPTGYASYLWNTGATSTCITTKLAGNYYVTVTDGGNCTATSNHLAVNVHPQPPVSISVNGDTLFAYNSVSYQWYFNGAIIQGATSPLFIANQPGLYTVLVTDANGCAALSLPVDIRVTGIGAIAKEEIKIYPNPLQNGNWNFECAEGLLGSTMEIFDNNGRLVYKTEVKLLKTEIALSVAKGIYIMKLTSGQKNLTVKLEKL
jgi:hypothetical protein